MTRHVARLEPIDQRASGSPARPGSWFITHRLGRPAGGTYTEVAMPAHAEALDRAVLETVVRAVAVELYGSAWAFIYGPEQHAEAIARWSSPRRELVVVEVVEVLS